MRTFIAFEIPEEIQAALRAAQKAMGRLAGVHWANTAGIHLTVKFIGEIEDANVPRVFDAMKQAAEGIAPIDYAVKDLGWFPPGRRPRVLWADVESGGEFAEIARRLDESLLGIGIAAEMRPFKPHLTLARVRGTLDADAVEAAFSRVGGRDFGADTADELVLFMSELLPGGARHTRMGGVPLKGTDQEDH